MITLTSEQETAVRMARDNKLKTEYIGLLKSKMDFMKPSCACASGHYDCEICDGYFEATRRLKNFEWVWGDRWA